MLRKQQKEGHVRSKNDGSSILVRYPLPFSSGYKRLKYIFSVVTIETDDTAVELGSYVVLTCTVEATDVGTNILWYMGDDNAKIIDDKSSYTIETTMAEDVGGDGETWTSISKLTVKSFENSGVSSYMCTVDYTEPILDDSSQSLQIDVLGYFN